ncbi:hypothetical protein GWK47_009608 [Chionoecetes opilio]|uniref:Uncharacterized protein n=1 Tax=Chionoecetes opilio TaxID=41210 RepID=A0A8J5CNI7_CHIOP|nr:hypothetical protein GWK47_009608 [Chionoecetes opilio]
MAPKKFPLGKTGHQGQEATGFVPGAGASSYYFRCYFRDEGQGGRRRLIPAPKQGWSLPDTTEQDLGRGASVKHLPVAPQYQRYHRKKASWEMKAKELGISLKPSRTGGKTSRTGMLSCPRGPWPGNQDVDGRGQVGVKNIAFYKSSMPPDVPDTLVNLPRDPSSDPRPPGTVPNDSGEANILEDMEVAAAAEQASNPP